MQRGLDRPGCGIGLLVLGLALSGCVGSGQLANLTDPGRPTRIAVESIDGPPPAVFHRFMKDLKQEASARRIAVVAPSEANYRLRAYLAAHADEGATAISWVLDVYDAGQHRAFRLSGQEQAAGRAWAAADDQLLARIASAGMERFAQFAASAPAPADSAQRIAASGRRDDWAPESSGIFRILARAAPRPAEIAADAGAPLPPTEVVLPKGRPALAGGTSATSFAYAPEDR
jgi:hypothetical protein